MLILETERLHLREMTQADFASLSEILQDNEVMYAYEEAFSDVEVQSWLDRQLRRYQEDKIGLWAVILKANNTMIGQCGLTMACRDYVFQTLRAENVCSIIRDTNVASRRVAERNGMRVVDQGVKHYRGIDMPHVLYEIKSH